MMRVTFSDNNEERIITSDCSRSRSTQQTLRRHSDMWWLVIMTLICLIAQPLLVSGQYGEWYTACKSFNDVTRKFFAGGCLYVLVVAYHDGQWDEDGNQMGLAFDPSKMRGFLERNWKLMEIPCRYYKTLCNPPAPMILKSRFIGQELSLIRIVGRVVCCEDHNRKYILSEWIWTCARLDGCCVVNGQTLLNPKSGLYQ